MGLADLARMTGGTGLPVVLLHAFPLSSAMWATQLEELSRAARIIAPDLPGFGRSPRQAAPEISGMAQQVAELLDALAIPEPVTVAGVSMGGYVALEFLRQFPRRVRGLALVSTRAVPDTAEGRQQRFKTAERVRTDGLAALAKAMLPKLLGRTTLASGPDVVDRVTQLILANSPAGVADALVAMADRRDSTDLLAGIRVPTLVVAGEEDTFIPAGESQALAAAIPGAQCVVIPQAGHLVPLEQPRLFGQHLLGFLSGRGPNT